MDLPAVASAQIPACGQDVHNPRGEDRRCGDGVVQCGTVNVVVANGANVTSIVYEVRETGGAWVDSVGWGTWETQTDHALADGRRQIGGTFRNWSGDRSREIRLTVS